MLVARTLVQRALQRWMAWRDCPWRRAVNEAGAGSDRAGHLFAAVLFPALLVAKTWLREGLPVLALKASTHAVLAAVLAAMSRRRGRWWRTYVSYRELLALLYCLHMQWVVRLTALHGGVNTMDHHGGSPLGLLLLLLGHTTALYGSLYALYARLLLPASAVALASMAATSLYQGERMCMRVLESPGVEAPLAELHSLLGITLGAPSPPFVSWLVTRRLTEPMQQCLAINAWLAVVVGAALPFFILRWLERRMRKAQQQQQQQQQQEAEQQQQQQQEAEQQQQEWQQGQTYGGLEAGEGLSCSWQAGGSVQLLIISSTVWILACGLQATKLQ